MPSRPPPDYAALRRERAAAWRSLDDVPPLVPGSPAAEFVSALEAAEHQVLAAADRAQAEHARRARENPLERDILRAIVRSLAAAGYVAHRLSVGSTTTPAGRRLAFGEPGMPDLLVELPDARCLWLEIKRPGAAPRSNQLAWHAKARARGQIVAVATSPEDALQIVTAAATGDCNQ